MNIYQYEQEMSMNRFTAYWINVISSSLLMRMYIGNDDFSYYQIEADKKIPPFSKRHFESIFLNENWCIIIEI